jgi:hypothetical protein
MPFVSRAQQNWGHTAAGQKALGGAAAVHEWDEATKGKAIPRKKGPPSLAEQVKRPLTLKAKR